ncbi:MAG TPA: winged helix-turn-helix domain-containing protein [Candidatus Thermoplasmatota archaeon]|nr:winged helix-turn-helix domain-containing protein [Candidatus Thermoplasmatota archaeon]
MAVGTEFDIYQGERGTVAVTNETRRRILEALAESDRELPDLVRMTGKSKPTLSNLHVRELLAQGLIEERPHPTDARRKVYRAKGRRIGRSTVPIEELRGAVRNYVATSPLAFAVPFKGLVEILAAGRATAAAIRRAQGRRLAEHLGPLLPIAGPRDLLTAVAALWEREGVARTGRIDLDRLEIAVDLDAAVPAGAAAEVLAGLIEGIATVRGVKGVSERTHVAVSGQRATFRVREQND